MPEAGGKMSNGLGKQMSNDQKHWAWDFFGFCLLVLFGFGFLCFVCFLFQHCKGNCTKRKIRHSLRVCWRPNPMPSWDPRRCLPAVGVEKMAQWFPFECSFGLQPWYWYVSWEREKQCFPPKAAFHVLESVFPPVPNFHEFSALLRFWFPGYLCWWPKLWIYFTVYAEHCCFSTCCCTVRLTGG